MIIDDRLEFCDATTSTGTGVSVLLGDVVDTGAFTKDLGAGENCYLVIQVDTAITGGTSIEFQLRSSSADTLASTPTTHCTTGTVSTTVNAGTTYTFPLPAGVYGRYMGIWMITVGAVAAGKINAFITKDASLWRSYADATN